jgi:hypothetical protein
MDVDALLSNMRAANFCAVMALGCLLLWALMEYVEWAEGKGKPAGQWCRQHGKPKHECREQHR